MGTIFQAVEEAALNYRPRVARDNFTGDLDELVASVLPKGACTCRGKCGSHIGPCGIKAGAEKICKACSPSTILAGGPGSGPQGGKGSIKNKAPKWLSEKDQHVKLDNQHKNLTELGYKWSNSSGGKGGVINHTYIHSLKTHGGKAIIHESALGKHSVDFTHPKVTTHTMKF